MKALPLLLAASLVANAALVTTVVIHSPDKTTAAAAKGDGTRKSKTSTARAGGKVTADDLVSALNANDPEALRDILQAAGLSDEMVRSFVQMRIWKRYEDRFKALQPKPDPNKPWWKDDPRQNGWYGGNQTKAQRDEMRKLQREVKDESERILGPDKNNSGMGGWRDQRLGFLPAEKRKQLQDIQQDYQELMGEVQQNMQGFQLPSDREKLRYLQAEQKRDMEAIMSPEERQAYDLRMSQTAQNLRWQMTRFDATEAEYMKIFPLQKAFDDQYNYNDPYGGNVDRGPDFWKQRQEAEKQLKEQMKAVVGEDRYKEFLRSQDGDYQQLQAAARRMELPPETATRVYALRDDVTAAAKQIADNPNIAADQKKQALVTLADSTRDKVRAALGQEAADAYLKNGMGWLKEIGKGNIVTFNQEGNGWNTTSISQPPQKKK